jgi:hypothetical protein
VKGSVGAVSATPAGGMATFRSVWASANETNIDVTMHVKMNILKAIILYCDD